MYPSGHQSFKKVISEQLHCPFCSGKQGNHLVAGHQNWRKVFKLNPISEFYSRRNENSTQKSTFEWLAEHMPFNIPPFLFKFPYVQSFLECLVIMFQRIHIQDVNM